MAWIEAIAVNQLQEKGRLCETVEGHKILFIWHNDAVHAVASQCPHFKLPLTKGKITEENTIVCPFHKSAFNLDTGKVASWSPWPPVVGPVLAKISQSKNLKIYPVRIENDKVEVEIG